MRARVYVSASTTMRNEFRPETLFRDYHGVSPHLRMTNVLFSLVRFFFSSEDSSSSALVYQVLTSEDQHDTTLCHYLTKTVQNKSQLPEHLKRYVTSQILLIKYT